MFVCCVSFLMNSFSPSKVRSTPPQKTQPKPNYREKKQGDRFHKHPPKLKKKTHTSHKHTHVSCLVCAREESSINKTTQESHGPPPPPPKTKPGTKQLFQTANKSWEKKERERGGIVFHSHNPKFSSLVFVGSDLLNFVFCIP